jgi:acyl carrier protein
MTPDRDQVLAKLTETLHTMFEIPMEKITPEARLVEDLDLDSIDAVDLVVQLQDYTGKRIPVAEFRSVRTVGDVVDQVHALLAS